MDSVFALGSCPTPSSDIVPGTYRNITGVSMVGQVAFTTPGSFSWTAPAGVTSVSVVAVGGGGEGGEVNTCDAAGGGGGGLGWKNAIAVTPGATYSVVVGAGGSMVSTSESDQDGDSGGDSYFISISDVAGFGGKGGSGGSSCGLLGGAGGNFVGDGGGQGGAGGNGNTAQGGGGGADAGAQPSAAAGALLPDTSCESCGQHFHAQCIGEWLQALPSSRRSFNVIFGNCPYCTAPISVNLLES